MKSWLLALSLFLPPSQVALAIDPGTAQGSLQVDGVTVPLRHAFAHLHDNAEKLLHRPRELRILLADRDVPQEALAGIGLLPLVRMAREGQVRGLLLQLDADQPSRGVLTVLHPSVDPGGLKRIVVRGDRATAIFADGQWLSLARQAGEWRPDD